jgi:hypoxanthine-DNA glycosylase
MNYVQGFPPISRPDARILILGSMPSRESLARRQYYAHPRNAFWPIITALLEIDTNVYEKRVEQVMHHGLAIWDVLQACFRAGSLDSAIEDRSLVVNDFNTFFLDHPHIHRVFFNGAKAEAVYRKHALPYLQGSAATLQLQRLPSTSPAHAGMSVEQKAAAWRVLLDDRAAGGSREARLLIVE